MKARNWVYGADGRLRVPWRIVLFIAVTYLCVFVAANFLGPVIAIAFSATRLRVASDGWTIVIALLGAHYLVLRLIDRRSWSDVGLDMKAARPVLLARGFFFGALAIGIPILLLIGVGWLVWTSAARTSWIAAALRVSMILLPAAFYEELATRGYIFAALRDGIGAPWALATTSVVFGLLHIRNAGASVESIVLVVLAGFFLGGILVATRSLYAAWMAHFAWNWTMAVLFHTAVSGIPLESPDYRLIDAGPDWATGGPWGPEGGVAGGLGMLGGLAYLYARRSSRRRGNS